MQSFLVKQEYCYDEEKEFKALRSILEFQKMFCFSFCVNSCDIETCAGCK